MNNIKTNNKTIAKNTMFLYLRMLVMMFISLFTSRIVLDKLGVVDFGIYNVVSSLVMLFTFIQGSLASSASRFLSYEIGIGTKKTLNNIFCMTMNIHILFAVLILIFSETIGLWYFFHEMVIPEDRRIASFIVYQLSNLSAIFAILVVPYRSMIIAKEHMKAFAYISIVEAFAKMFIAFCLTVVEFDRLILYGFLLFVVQVSIMYLYYRYCKKHFEESHFSRYWDKNVFKEMFVFSGWSVCSYVSTGVVSQIYNLMLNLFFGPVVNAARAIAYQVQTTVYNFVINFQVALNPQIIKNHASGNEERVYELVLLSSRVSFSLLYILLFPLLVNIDYLLSLWLVKVPENANLFIILICLSSTFGTFGNPLSVVAEAANRLKYYNQVTIPLYLIPVLFSYLLLKVGSPAATVFLMTIFVEFIAFFLKLKIAHKLINIPIKQDLFLYLKCTFSVFVAIILGYIIRQYLDNTLLTTLIALICCGLFSLIWIVCFILSKQERCFIINKVRNGR